MSPVIKVSRKTISIRLMPYFAGRCAVRLRMTMQRALVGPVTRWLELPVRAATMQMAMEV